MSYAERKQYVYITPFWSIIPANTTQHIKPITTAIAASPHSLTPLSPESSNPLTIQVPLPPPTGESRRAAVDSAVKASERADKMIQVARQEHNKKMRK